MAKIPEREAGFSARSRARRSPTIHLTVRYYNLKRRIGNRSGAPRALLSLPAARAKAHAKPATAHELGLTLPSDIPLKTIDGEAATLGDFAEQGLLIVNVASQCGFTPQYAGLEALHRRFRARGFAVLGFPCDQFGHQEPGDDAEIKNFCSLNYDVTFPMFAKIEVNGANAHPLFKALKQEAPGLLGTQAIKWNFTKFLIDRNRRVVRRYAPSDKPEKLAGDIEAALD
jgi:glutathione peroxidase